MNLTWKMFSETGNIEAYLLVKQLEDEPFAESYKEQVNDGDTSSANTNM